MLITNIFSFLYNIFKRPKFPQGHQNISPRVNPLPDDKILDWSKLKQIADNISKRI